ncbi:hypothetical protein OF829_18890 [Sphingomonas sp. LB-2]|uniref:hypothetical protein n=1 Tax=Sphingomonas caeni TaxID=2984949 RepID=UPI0022328C2C|nr:hypothetical protein [Sphingomonas caeni]MCW3849310.1 hypothetical protein [Sphingomonas caeni]
MALTAMDPTAHIRATIMARRQCLVTPGYLRPDECGTLLDWARRMPPHMSFSEGNRYFGKLVDLPDVPALATELRLRLEQAFGLEGLGAEECRHGWFLSIGNPGSGIRPHHDLPPPGTRIVRCNLFLQVPTRGGRPVIENVPFEVEQGTLLAFLPSDLLHWSPPVEGRKRRIVLSFGYTVPGNYLLPASACPTAKVA